MAWHQSAKLSGAYVLVMIVMVFVYVVSNFQPDSDVQSEWSNGKMIRLNVSECRCSKKVRLDQQIDPLEIDNDTSDQAVTCSQDVKALGRGQRVVSYSFYQGPTFDTFQRDYFSGISHNVRTIKKYYPGYRMRLYYRLTDNELAMERLCQLACEEEILDLCDISRNPMVLNASSYYPLVWRFLPALDAQVDLMLSRDLDSDITAREQAAVSEFLHQENKTFHIMRDHKDHTIEILGGTWAVKLDHGLTRHLMAKGMKKMLQDPTVLNIGKDRGLDQFLLVRYVWPLARKARIIFAHDSFHCMSYPFSIGFPTQREQSEGGNFIGAVRTVNEPLKVICPRACRRGHLDWIYC